MARWAIKFDLTGEIPFDATVLEAILALYKYKQSVTMKDTGRTSVHVITTDWTAFNADSIRPWNTYMGDMERTGLDTFSYEARGLGWQEYTITSAVQDFITNPSKNYGVMVRVTDSSVYIIGGGGDTISQLMTYHSAAASDTAKQYRPKLTVTYTTDPTENIKNLTINNDKVLLKQLKPGSISLYTPYRGICIITDLHGRIVEKITINRKGFWEKVPLKLGNGMYLLNINGAKETYNRKINIIK